MRTTLIISTPVFNRAKRFAKEKGIRLSALATEAMEEYLLNSEKQKKEENRQRISIEPFAMGSVRVYIDNREALYRCMEET